MWELVANPEAVIVEGGGGLYIRFAGQQDDEDPRVVRGIGLWATDRGLELSIRLMLALLRKCTRRDVAEARTRLAQYSTTTYANIGADVSQRSNNDTERPRFHTAEVWPIP